MQSANGSFLFFRYFGPGSLKVAMNYHLVARTHSCRGDFRAALQSEKEAFTIYKRTVRIWSLALCHPYLAFFSFFLFFARPVKSSMLDSQPSGF